MTISDESVRKKDALHANFKAIINESLERQPFLNWNPGGFGRAVDRGPRWVDSNLVIRNGYVHHVRPTHWFPKSRWD